MKSFRNINARSLTEAAQLLAQTPRSIVVAGGSDALGLVKERILAPDAVINLKTVRGLDGIVESAGGLRVGAAVTLEAISRHPVIRQRYTALAEAAGQVGTPQIRNVGTIGGNLAQRPWCWYYRNNFPCYKNGGNQCFSITGENDFHAIFGGGPSFIVHPSDTAPALVALEARLRIVGPRGERTVAAADFFKLPSVNPARENDLASDEVLAEVILPAPRNGLRSSYYKVLDREAWTHAVVSAAVALEIEGGICRSARVVLGGVAPIPWRVPEVEAMLAGQRITSDLAARAGVKAVEGARPLAKNAYKIPLTSAIVRQTLLQVGSSA